MAVLVGNLIADQLAEVDQHLLVGCQHLLDLILLAPLIVEDGQFRFRGLVAAVACGEQGVVHAVHFPLSPFPVRCELIAEGGLCAITASYPPLQTTQGWGTPSVGSGGEI